MFSTNTYSQGCFLSHIWQCVKVHAIEFAGGETELSVELANACEKSAIGFQVGIVVVL